MSYRLLELLYIYTAAFTNALHHMLLFYYSFCIDTATAHFDYSTAAGTFEHFVSSSIPAAVNTITAVGRGVQL